MDYCKAGLKGFFFFAVFLCIASSASANWPVFHGNVEHTGYNKEYSGYRGADFVVFWNYSANGSLTSPVTGDLDGDGFEEVVFGSDNGMVYALRSNGSLLWSFKSEGKVKSAPTVGNLSKGKFMQVVFGSSDGSVYALDFDGSLLWSFKTNGSVSSSPLIVDVVNGPKPGVVFGSSDGFFYILHDDGKLFWNYDFKNPIDYSPALADVDGNGVKDFVFSSGDKMNVLSFSPFKIITTIVESEISTVPMMEGGSILAGSEEGGVYKFVRDTYEANESVISTANDRVGWLNRSKEIEILKSEAIFNCTKGVYSTPAYADLDYNSTNKNEYVFGCDDGNLYIMHHRFNDTKIIRYTTSKPVKSAPVLADLNGNDTDIEIIFGSDDGFLYVINSTGFGRWSYYLGGRVSSSPAVSDLDSDGFLEVVVGNSQGVLYCFGSNTSVLKSEGRGYYNTAKSLLNLLEFENSTEYGLKAFDVYSRINYTKGLEDVNTLFLDLSAKEHCLKAREYYEKELYNETVFEVEMADMVYFEARHDVKSECNNILVNAKARMYYEEAVVRASKGFFSDAKSYAQGSYNLSLQSVDSYTSSKASILLDKLEKLENAQKIFNDAISDYFSNSSGDALSRMKNSEKVYLENNASEVFKSLRPLMQSIESDIYVKNMTLLLHNNRFKDAYYLALKARELCNKSGNTDCIAKSEIVINETYAHVEAEGLLETAKKYYTATDFITAGEYAEKALGLYSKLGNEEKVLEAEELLNKSAGMKEQSSGTSFFEKLPKPVLFLLAFEVVAIVVILATRPKPKAWFRGFIGLGRTVSKSKRVKAFSGRRLTR